MLGEVSGRRATRQLFPRSLLLALFLCFFLLSLAHASFADYTRRGGPRRRCYQCNMPFECESGACTGDFCVKSLAAPMPSNTGYVSKGCENITGNGMLVDRQQNMCKLEMVFGIETMVCYCTDRDFCNGSHLQLQSSLFIFFAFLFVFFH